MQLGDYIKIILLCAVLLPVVAGFLLSTNSKWSQGMGKVIGVIGFLAAAAIGLLILFVIVISIWLAYQMANQ